MANIARLVGARVALTASHAERLDINIDTHAGRILPFESRYDERSELDLTGHLLLPGLINAHDHLEFSLFPRLGRGPYPNASSWAADIYHPEKAPIKEHLLVPKTVRLVWGGIKNLLSGVTTVAHHNRYEASVFNARFPVRVLSRYAWAHSLDFSPDVREIYERTPPQWPFIIHAAEGTDDIAHTEIPRLEELGVLDRRTVLVHAVAMRAREQKTLVQSGASIIWCPSSNLFTLGRTLTAETVISDVPAALGTDSSLTGQGDLIDEIKCARITGVLTPKEIYPLVTINAARILRLSAGQGMILATGVADLVAVVDTGQTPAQALVDLRPELVIVRGRVRLMSERFAARTAPRFDALHRIQIENRGAYLVRAAVPRLYAAATAAIGSELRLGGKRICI